MMTIQGDAVWYIVQDREGGREGEKESGMGRGWIGVGWGKMGGMSGGQMDRGREREAGGGRGD